MFDVEKAWKYFETVDGDSYGIRNFIFGWIDTNH